MYSFPVPSYSHVHGFLWGAALLKSEREVYCYITLHSSDWPKRPRVELLTYRIELEPYEPSTCVRPPGRVHYPVPGSMHPHIQLCPYIAHHSSYRPKRPRAELTFEINLWSRCLVIVVPIVFVCFSLYLARYIYIYRSNIGLADLAGDIKI